VPHLLRHAFLRSYPKDPWFYLLNAVLLAKEQPLPILNVLGLTRPTRAGLELTIYRLLSESTTTRLRQASPVDRSHPPWAQFHDHEYGVIRCLSKSVCQVRSNYWYEKCQTTYGSMKVCNFDLDNCNGYRTCKTLTSNETVEIPMLKIFIIAPWKWQTLMSLFFFNPMPL
jgi:hypothetical protein